MKERPILFSGPMVRAILEGRKTQTRRVVKPQPHQTDTGLWKWMMPDGACGYPCDVFRVKIGRWSAAPYSVGDRMWVREPGRVVTHFEYMDNAHVVIRYLANNYTTSIALPERLRTARWVKERQGIPNGIFREAARIHLEITDVRVERLQGISVKDAAAEGLETVGSMYRVELPRCDFRCDDPRVAFRALWDSLAACGTRWDANPWVWAISFKVVTP